MKKKSSIKKLSDVISAAGFGVAAVGIYKTVKVRASLPPGTCPIKNQRELFFTAIGLLSAAVVIDWVAEKKEKSLEK